MHFPALCLYFPHGKTNINTALKHGFSQRIINMYYRSLHQLKPVTYFFNLKDVLKQNLPWPFLFYKCTTSVHTKIHQNCIIEKNKTKQNRHQ